jgi:phage terminase large subunit-like protein
MLRRELYDKYTEVFTAGSVHQERCTLGGNRVGKTLGIGGYETALHLTGLYPHWWDGHRYNKPMLAWAAGTKSAKVRDVNQKFLLGTLHQRKGFTQAEGGLIPAARIGRLTRRTGVADAVDQVIVRHVNGFENVCTFKSYEEGRSSFEAEAVDWIWLDEEPSKAIYDECKMRILTTRGRILATFTPVEGLTETVLALLEGTDLI